MQENKTGLVHSDHSPCEGHNNCSRSVHYPAPAQELRIQADMLGSRLQDPEIAVALVHQDLLSCTCNLSIITQIPRKKSLALLALRVSTVFAFGAHRMIEESYKGSSREKLLEVFESHVKRARELLEEG